MKKIIRDLKVFRNDRGWRPVHTPKNLILALQTGLHQTDISKFESGRLQPYPPQAERLAVVLGIDADDLQKEIS